MRVPFDNIQHELMTGLGLLPPSTAVYIARNKEIYANSGCKSNIRAKFTRIQKLRHFFRKQRRIQEGQDLITHGNKEQPRNLLTCFTKPATLQSLRSLQSGTYGKLAKFRLAPSIVSTALRLVIRSKSHSLMLMSNITSLENSARQP